MKKILFLIFFFLTVTLSVPSYTYATGYTITQPGGPFTQGQEIDIVVSIDTQTATLTTAQTSMTFETQYLEYVSTSPGTLFPEVVGTINSPGNLTINGSVASGNPGVTGTGVFATVKFTLLGSPTDDVNFCTIATPTPTTNPAATSAIPTPTFSAGNASPTTAATGSATGDGSGGAPSIQPKKITTLPRTGTLENILFILGVGTAITSLGFGIKKLTTK